jgi:hypothetical protein
MLMKTQQKCIFLILVIIVGIIYPVASALSPPKYHSIGSHIEKGTYSGFYGYNENGEQTAIATISGSFEKRFLSGSIDGVWILNNNGYYKEDSMKGVFVGHLLLFTLSGVHTFGLITFDANGNFNGVFKVAGAVLPILNLWGTYQSG